MNFEVQMKRLIMVLLLFSLASCKEKGVSFEITNHSNFDITHVKFFTSEKLSQVKFDRIEAGKRVCGFLSMKTNRADGTYILEFTDHKGLVKTVSAGYYTNGAPLDKSVLFEIDRDTSFIRFTPSSY